MSNPQPYDRRTQLTVFLLNDEVRGADALRIDRLSGDSVLLPEGELYFGGKPTKERTVPSWLSGFFGPEVVAQTQFQPRVSSGVFMVNVGEVGFAVALGHGQSLLIKERMSRQFGLRVALGVLVPSMFKLRLPVDTLARFTDASELMGRGMGVGEVLRYSISDPQQPITKSVAVRPSIDYMPLLGREVLGGDGFSFKAPGTRSSLMHLVRFLFKTHQTICAAGEPFNELIIGYRLERIIGYVREEFTDAPVSLDTTPPEKSEILFPLLRSVDEAGTDVGPSELYHPVARMLDSAVMHPDPNRYSRKKRTYKKRLRNALRVLENAGLVTRIRLGRYRVTSLGQRVGAENVEISQQLLNRLFRQQRQARSGAGRPA